MSVIRVQDGTIISSSQDDVQDVNAAIAALTLDSLSDVDTTGVVNNSIIKYNSTSGFWEIGTDTDTGITEVVEDTTPQLGGDLDAQTFDINNVTDLDVQGTFTISDGGGGAQTIIATAGLGGSSGLASINHIDVSNALVAPYIFATTNLTVDQWQGASLVFHTVPPSLTTLYGDTTTLTGTGGGDYALVLPGHDGTLLTEDLNGSTITGTGHLDIADSTTNTLDNTTNNNSTDALPLTLTKTVGNGTRRVGVGFDINGNFLGKIDFRQPGSLDTDKLLTGSVLSDDGLTAYNFLEAQSDEFKVICNSTSNSAQTLIVAKESSTLNTRNWLSWRIQDGGSQYWQWGIDARRQSSTDKRLRFSEFSDDGSTVDTYMELTGDKLQVYKNFEVDGTAQIDGTLTANDTSTLNDTLTVNATTQLNDQLTQTVDGSTTGDSIKLTSELPVADGIHNYLTSINDYGTNTVPDGTQLTYSFKVKDSTIGEDFIGRLAFQYDTGGNHAAHTRITNATGSNVANTTLDTNKFTSSVPFEFPSYTTTERNALSPSNGWVLYNSTDNKLQVYAGGSWVDLH